MRTVAFKAICRAGFARVLTNVFAEGTFQGSLLALVCGRVKKLTFFTWGAAIRILIKAVPTFRIARCASLSIFTGFQTFSCLSVFNKTIWAFNKAGTVVIISTAFTKYAFLSRAYLAVTRTISTFVCYEIGVLILGTRVHTLVVFTIAVSFSTF